MKITPQTTAAAILPSILAPLSTPGEVVPVEQPSSPPATLSTEQADTVISLTLRDLALVTTTPIVLARDGLTWFDTGTDGLEISAAGDAVGFTHWSRATIRGPSAKECRGFGLPAGELASVAQWALRQVPSVGLDLHCGTDEIIAIPNPTSLTDGVPLEACLIGIPESPGELKIFLHDNLPHFPLTAYFERPGDFAKREERKDLGQLDRATFIAAVSAVKGLVPKDDTRPDLELLELHDGVMYGGGQEALFLVSTPSLAGIDLSFTREQLRPLLRLLRLLPSRTCQLGRDNHSNILSNSRTKLYFKVPNLRHPADGPRLLEQQPTAGVVVEADRLCKRLDSLRQGRGANCSDAFLHLELGANSSVKIEGRRPSDGKQTVKGVHLHLADQPGLAYDFLTPLAGMEKALAGCKGKKVSLRTRPLPTGEPRTGQRQHLYVSTAVTDAPGVVCTVRLPAVQALTPDRLAAQVRQLAKGRAAINSPGRKRRALT